MADYYDRNALRITREQWTRRVENPEYKRVASDEPVEGVRVSTVWLGLDHSFGGGLPLIFETMVFGGPHDRAQERYTFEADALEGHRRWVEAVARGTPDLEGRGEP